jgi:uncharacterized protein YcbX
MDHAIEHNVELSPAEPLTAVITALSTTPIKGLRVVAREELMLTEVGAADNRCFFLIDDRDRMVNGKLIGALTAVVADYDVEREHLSLHFPDGHRVAAEVRAGGPIETQFFSSRTTAQLVLGPFSEALSEHAACRLRLVRADPRRGAVDRGPRGAVSLISEASLQRLSELAGAAVDPRRFRMLAEVAGFRAHGEDALVGHRARVGEALIAFHGHVGRCLITGRDPETGDADLPTLDLLASYRQGLGTTEPLPFGVYGEVLEPGRVKLGDPVCPE